MRRALPSVLAFLLLAAACGDDAATTAAGSTRVVTVMLVSGSVGVTVDGASVGPGSRVEVGVGDRITIAVSGDAADEIHIHGYDLSVEVGPGATDTLEFTADIPGVFEVELEGAHTLVFELEVS